jgi:N6-adenosine-specific RNA methylase IME4
MEKHKLNIFPEMQPEDFDRLLNDLETNGYDSTQPIYIYEDKILDGWNRYIACAALEIEPITFTFDGTYKEALDFVMRTNKRRNLTSSQWAAIAVEAEDMVQVIREVVEQERRAKISEARLQPETVQLIVPSAKDTTRLSDTKLANTFNTNRTYVNDAAKIKSENPELFNQVKAGEISLPKAVQETKRAEVIAKLESIEVKEAKADIGKYDVVVLDPPWPMEKVKNDDMPNQVNGDYATMSEAELECLSIPAADDCHIWVWTSHKLLPMALRLLKKWGMKYVCAFTWHKNGGYQHEGLPQFNCEFAIYAVKGNPEFIDTNDFKLCFNAEIPEQYVKPIEFYEMVKRVTAGRRLEMFSHREIDGFDRFG